MKILKSKVDVEAEQNASSFTSTVSTEPYIYNGHLTNVSVSGEGGKEEDVSESRGADRVREAAAGHKSSPSDEFCQSGSHASKVGTYTRLLSIHQIKSVMFYRVTRDAVNRESPRFRETRASPKHNRGILEIAT